VIDDVRSDFPPIRTLEIPTNLRHPSRGQVHDIEAPGRTAVLLPDEGKTSGIRRPRGGEVCHTGEPTLRDLVRIRSVRVHDPEPFAYGVGDLCGVGRPGREPLGRRAVRQPTFVGPIRPPDRTR
jgi:hypothetical protein